MILNAIYEWSTTNALKDNDGDVKNIVTIWQKGGQKDKFFYRQLRQREENIKYHLWI